MILKSIEFGEYDNGYIAYIWIAYPCFDEKAEVMISKETAQKIFNIMEEAYLLKTPEQPIGTTIKLLKEEAARMAAELAELMKNIEDIKNRISKDKN